MSSYFKISKRVEGDENFKSVFDSVKKINKLDRKSDAVFEKAVTDIFENETDAKNIIHVTKMYWHL